MLTVVEREFNGKKFYFYEPRHMGWINNPAKAIQLNESDGATLVLALRRRGYHCKLKDI